MLRVAECFRRARRRTGAVAVVVGSDVAGPSVPDPAASPFSASLLDRPVIARHATGGVCDAWSPRGRVTGGDPGRGGRGERAQILTGVQVGDLDVRPQTEQQSLQPRQRGDRQDDAQPIAVELLELVVGVRLGDPAGRTRCDELDGAGAARQVDDPVARALGCLEVLVGRAGRGDPVDAEQPLSPGGVAAAEQVPASFAATPRGTGRRCAASSRRGRRSSTRSRSGVPRRVRPARRRTPRRPRRRARPRRRRRRRCPMRRTASRPLGAGCRRGRRRDGPRGPGRRPAGSAPRHGSAAAGG